MRDRLLADNSLKHLCTLRAGGSADLFFEAKTLEDLANVSLFAQKENLNQTTLGVGSNVLPSDRGVRGLVVHNRASNITVQSDGAVMAESGCLFQDLFLKTAQASLAGLEFAVGIPGSLGGALVSNAGAYRSNVSKFLTELEIVFEGERRWVDPSFMQFSYRDSILRSERPPQCVILQAKLQLPAGKQHQIFNEAREYQRQRIGKQPAPASAGSFFKNVYDQSLADSLENLPERLRSGGVVPSGYLIEAVGLKGARHGGAMLASRHANFMLNVGGATAWEIRDLAEHAKAEVSKRFDVTLEEEVLYLGDWYSYTPTPVIES